VAPGDRVKPALQRRAQAFSLRHLFAVAVEGAGDHGVVRAGRDGPVPSVIIFFPWPIGFQRRVRAVFHSMLEFLVAERE